MAINMISGVGSIPKVPLEINQIKDVGSDKASFADFLNQSINNTNDLIANSEKIADDFAAGATDNIHEVMIATEKADIALQFTMQVRSKILDAYTEIMRMQI